MNYKRMILLSTMLFISIVLFSFYQSQSNQAEPDFKESIAKGQIIYTTYCMSCHMSEGEGIAGVYPPLAGSDYLMADKQRAIQVVMFGMTGEIQVNGQTYNNQMPDLGLSDEEVTHVLNYVRNSWGNEGEAVTFGEVKAVRDQGKP